MEAQPIDEPHERPEDALLRLSGEAEQRVARIEHELAELMRARSSESDDDEHDPEGVPLSSEWSRLEGLLESARANRQQLADALLRLGDGSYGVCTRCGRPIPAERLRVRPFAEQCVPCASARR